MELARTLLLVVHITAGSLSLILFWIPIFSRKGGARHRKTGRWYAYAMMVVVCTAAILSVIMLIQGDRVVASILVFLSLITAHPLWEGWAMLRQRNTPTSRFRSIQRTFAASTLILGVLFLMGWHYTTDTLFLVFGCIGTVAGSLNLWSSLRSSINKPWIQTHYEGMLFSGGAAYTAFLAFGARAVFPAIESGAWGFLPWILPTVLVFVGVAWLKRTYSLRPASK